METTANKDFTFDMYEKFKRIFLSCMQTVFERSYSLEELKEIDEYELSWRIRSARNRRGSLGDYTPTPCINSSCASYDMFDVQTYMKIFTTLKLVRLKVVGDWMEEGKKLEAEANKVLNLAYLVKEYRNEIAHDNPIADIMSSSSYMLV